MRARGLAVRQSSFKRVLRLPLRRFERPVGQPSAESSRAAAHLTSWHNDGADPGRASAAVLRSQYGASFVARTRRMRQSRVQPPLPNSTALATLERTAVLTTTRCSLPPKGVIKTSVLANCVVRGHAQQLLARADMAPGESLSQRQAILAAQADVLCTCYSP